MARVHCKLENASTEINGFAFEDHPDGHKVSVGDIPLEVAEANFGGIRGYDIEDTSSGGQNTKEPKEPEPTAVGDQGAASGTGDDPGQSGVAVVTATADAPQGNAEAGAETAEATAVVSKPGKGKK